MKDFGMLARWQSATPGAVLRGRRSAGTGQDTIHFVHGNGFCGGVYWPMLREFLPDYGLFLHDVEGHGESEAPAHFSGAVAVADRIATVIHEQGLAGRPLIGMGHSFGSQVTVLAAARHPGLFKALVLTDPIVFPPLMWAGLRALSLAGRHPFARAARRRRDTWPSRAAAVNHLHGRGIYKGWSEDAFLCFVDHALKQDGERWKLRCPKELEAEIFERPAWPWSAWRRIEVPILFLRGAQSYGFFPLAERWARALNPRVELRQLPGGHCFMQEQPERAAAVIRDFLGRI